MAKTKNTTDKQTLELIEQVKNQKAEIARTERPSWKTNCSFSYNEDFKNVAVNIHVESSVKNLVLYAAFLLNKKDSYKDAATALGVTVPELTWGGFTIEDWMEDFRLRINQIQIGAKKKKLESLESRLNAIISPELKAQLELDAIASELD